MVSTRDRCRRGESSFEVLSFRQVRVELAFQSTDSFADGYIEEPDDVHAPPPTGWRRHDTHFHLLVYYDPPTAGQVSTVQLFTLCPFGFHDCLDTLKQKSQQ